MLIKAKKGQNECGLDSSSVALYTETGLTCVTIHKDQQPFEKHMPQIIPRA